MFTYSLSSCAFYEIIMYFPLIADSYHWPSEDIFFSLCKGKSLFPNGLGIRYGFRKIFLSLLERVFDAIRPTPSDGLSSSSTFEKQREKKIPDGKELKSSEPQGKKLNNKQNSKL